MIKRLLYLPMELRWVRRLTRTFLRNQAVIFMAHRFAQPGVMDSGHDPHQLDKCLRMLGKDGVDVLPLWDLIQRGAAGEDVSGMVAFTVDDGYADFFDVAAPIFRSHGCPVTLFPVTGFLDGDTWMWWDKVRYIIVHSNKTSFEAEIRGEKSAFPLRDQESRLRTVRALRSELAKMSVGMREEAQGRLEQELGVAVPEDPPPGFRPLTWDQVRELETAGITFGPHTVDHPNLATLSPTEAEHQIRASWERLQSETCAAVPVFCFPYGTSWSLSPTLTEYLTSAGLRAAVTAEEGHVSAEGFGSRPFHLPRMGWPDTSIEVRNITSGLARAKEMVRSG